MKPKTMIAVAALAALPFFATAAAQHQDGNSQATAGQTSTPAMMPGHMMGHGMMNLIDQVRNDLASLRNETDTAVLHKRLAHDQSLLDEIRSQMRSMQGMAGSMMPGNSMMSGGMGMSRHMSNCSGAVQQPQK